MIPVDEALARVLALAPQPRPETIPLAEAHGRVLLHPASARLTQPPFDASAMDGYAMRAADLPGPLRLIGTSAAGHPWSGTVAPGTAVRIFTGAPVPAGFDHVELQENTSRDGDSVTVHTPSPGPNIRVRGNDFAHGDMVDGGRVLTPALIALLAAMNVDHVTVACRPLVAVLSGGDELVPLGATPAPGQIISSNDLALAAMIVEAGAQPLLLPVARDTEEALRAGFDAARDAQLLVTVGGASVGDHDLIAKVAADHGVALSFHKIALRPGKPLMAGMRKGGALLGLPGNPVSAMVCATLFMRPLIRAMLGLDPQTRTYPATLGRDLAPEGPRQHYLRARLTFGRGDLPIVTPFDDQDSARLAIMAQADALLVRPPNDPARKTGDRVEYIPLHS